MWVFICRMMIIVGETYKRMIINVGCEMLFIYYDMILGCGYLYVGGENRVVRHISGW